MINSYHYHLFTKRVIISNKQRVRNKLTWSCMAIWLFFRGGPKVEPEAALDFLSKYCKWAVVTLGSKGCIAKHGKEVSTLRYLCFLAKKNFEIHIVILRPEDLLTTNIFNSRLLACFFFFFFPARQVVRVPATGEGHAIDATGAGDLFASGFIYGLVKGLSLEDCCKVGSCSGGSVTRALGGEVMPENWQWMYKQLKSKGLAVPHNAS